MREKLLQGTTLDTRSAALTSSRLPEPVATLPPGEPRLISELLQDGTMSWSGIRRYFHVVHCSETRPSEARRQLSELIARRLVEVDEFDVYRLTVKGRALTAAMEGDPGRVPCSPGR